MRRWLIACTAPWVFRTRARTARKLRDLAATEQGSFLSLQWAASQTPSPQRQSSYLRHAADEARHARLFWERARELEAPSSPLRADGEDLFRELGEVGFLAFVHHAERRGREQFEVYARYLERSGRLEEHELFTRIAREETHHEAYSLKLLDELTGAPAERCRQLRRVRLWEGWRAWRRVGRSSAHGVYVGTMWLLFPLLLVYSLLVRSMTRARRGWVDAGD